jgi:DNA-binding transcriptional MocR family regulator
MGSCMPDAHRRRLADIAARHRVPVIEDDIYGDLHFGDTRPPLVRAFDHAGWVLTAGSVSKTIAPGYRVGWLLGGRWLEEAVSRKHALSMATASLPQQAIAAFLDDGAYDRHLRRTRARYREQVERMRDAIARHFPAGTRVSDPRGGFLLWVQLPEGADGLAVHRAAKRERIHVAPGHLFSTGEAYNGYLRLSCGVPWSERVEAALRRLGEIVASCMTGSARLE